MTVFGARCRNENDAERVYICMHDPASQNSWSKTVSAPPTAPQTVPPIKAPPPSSATRTVLFVLGGFAALFLVIVAVYIAAMSAKPRIVAPTRPPLPKQNGFPLLKSATTKTIREKDVADAVALSPKKKWTISEKRALVAANSAGLTATRKALAYPYVEEIRAPGINTKFPYYPKFRQMTRILVLAGNVAWEDGKQREAIEYYADALTIGRRVPNRTSLIGRLVGIACESIARRAVWERLENMNADTATYCLMRLQTLQAERLPFSVTLEEEKYGVQRMAMEAMEHPDQYRNFTETGGGSPSSDDEKDMERIIQTYGKIVPRTVVADTLGNHMDKIIAQSQKPYMQSKKEIPLPKELFTAILVPVINNARLKFVANETGDALLRTALALRIYQKRNNKYPATLSDLVAAKLLPAVPDDPFAMPRTYLVYKPLTGGKYLLYSIGPDSVDDQGKGSIRTGSTGKTVRRIDLASKGDLVAGWYFY